MLNPMLNPDFRPIPSSDVSPEDMQVIRHQAFMWLLDEVYNSISFLAKGEEEEEKKALAICRSFEKQGYAGGNY